MKRKGRKKRTKREEEKGRKKEGERGRDERKKYKERRIFIGEKRGKIKEKNMKRGAIWGREKGERGKREKKEIDGKNDKEENKER